MWSWLRYIIYTRIRFRILFQGFSNPNTSLNPNPNPFDPLLPLHLLWQRNLVATPSHTVHNIHLTFDISLPTRYLRLMYFIYPYLHQHQLSPSLLFFVLFSFYCCLVTPSCYCIILSCLSYYVESFDDDEQSRWWFIYLMLMKEKKCWISL